MVGIGSGEDRDVLAGCLVGFGIGYLIALCGLSAAGGDIGSLVRDVIIYNSVASGVMGGFLGVPCGEGESRMGIGPGAFQVLVGVVALLLSFQTEIGTLAILLLSAALAVTSSGLACVVATAALGPQAEG
jgi:hypothetical protein